MRYYHLVLATCIIAAFVSAVPVGQDIDKDSSKDIGSSDTGRFEKFRASSPYASSQHGSDIELPAMISGSPDGLAPTHQPIHSSSTSSLHEDALPKNPPSIHPIRPGGLQPNNALTESQSSISALTLGDSKPKKEFVPFIHRRLQPPADGYPSKSQIANLIADKVDQSDKKERLTQWLGGQQGMLMSHGYEDKDEEYIKYKAEEQQGRLKKWVEDQRSMVNSKAYYKDQFVNERETVE